MSSHFPTRSEDCRHSSSKNWKRSLFSGLLLFSSLPLLFPVSGNAAPASLNVSVTCNASNVGNLSVTVGDNTWDKPNAPTSPYKGKDQSEDIKATFTAVNLDTVATQCGGGHLNWLNIARDPAGNPTKPFFLDSNNKAQYVEFPFVDPISKGNFPGSSADTLPFYWDENAGTSGVKLASNLFSNKTLQFFDQPLSQANSSFFFDTYLVSVPGAIGQTIDKNFKVLSGFTWKFSVDGSNKTSITLGSGPIALTDGSMQSITNLLNRGGPRDFAGWTASAIGKNTTTASIAPSPSTVKSASVSTSSPTIGTFRVDDPGLLLSSDSVSPKSGTPIPEPGSVFGLLTIGILGLVSKLKR